MGQVNSGSLLDDEEAELLRPAEGDSTELLLLKTSLLNRYLLVQLQSLVLRLIEVQSLQTKELERLIDAEGDLTLSERLALVEEQVRLEDMDALAVERLRELFLGEGPG